MAVVINGTTGITSVNGSAAAPSVTGTDTDTGIVYGTNTITLATNGTAGLYQDASQNIGLGTTSPAILSYRVINAVGSGASQGGLLNLDVSDGSATFRLYSNSSGATISMDDNLPMVFNTNGTERARIDSSGNFSISSGNLTVGGATSNIYMATGSERTISASGSANSTVLTFKRWTGAAYNSDITMDGSGNLLVGLTSTSGYLDGKVNSLSSGAAYCGRTDGGSGTYVHTMWNTATSGNNSFVAFVTESAAAVRGSITYNRGGGLTAYNTTSDYRAKTVNGSVQNALEKVSLLSPKTGRMNGAEFDIDFFVAHELAEVVPSAVTGEKDAIKEDGTPDYQMVDKSALIPLLTAAIQEQQAIIESLKSRLDAANI